MELTVYHGTNAPAFKRFDPSLRGTATDDGFLGSGFYFSTDPQVGRSAKTTIEARVRLDRPLVLSLPTWETDKRKLINRALGTTGLKGAAVTAEAERQGFDGVVLDYSPVGYIHKEVVAFDPSQVEIVGPYEGVRRLRESHRLQDATDWRSYLVPGDDRYIPAVVLPEAPDAVTRALAAGAEPPLEYVGSGMTGIVFCTGDIAYKVARSMDPVYHSFLGDESEWLAAAGRVPEVAPYVARLHHFDANNLVIVRDCPRPAPDMTPYRYGDGRLWDLHRQIERWMIPHGWTAPEFKLDSYVITDRGPVLVDASMPLRVGAELAYYVEAVIRGDRSFRESDRPRDLIFYVQREVGQTLTKAEAERLTAMIEERWPGASAGL